MESRLIPTLICVAIVVLIFSLMRLGWNNRKKRQNTIAPLAQVPLAYDDVEARMSVAGTYVSTTTAEDWLDRVAVQTLGVKSKAQVLIYHDALIIAREGAQDLYIPATDVQAVRTEAGMSGKFVEKDGLVLITWNHQGTLLDTGIRTQLAAQKKDLIAAVTAIAPHSAAPITSAA